MGFSAAATIFTGASALIGAQQASAQAEAQRERLAYQSQITERNRELKIIDAQRIQSRGRRRERLYRERIQQSIGSVRAHGAASGFTVDEGINRRLQGDQQFAGEMDILHLRQATEDRARATLQQADNLEFESQLTMAERESIDPGAIGVSTLLSGAAGTARVGFNTGAFG